MNLPQLRIQRPVMTTLLIAAFMVFGITSYQKLPISALSEVDFPTITVTASPGAETMAPSAATVIEKQLSAISGYIDGAALDVQSPLSVAQRTLPAEMTTPPSFPQGQSVRRGGYGSTDLSGREE